MLKVGDQVEIPITKSVGVSWSKSELIKRALSYGQPFLFVIVVRTVKGHSIVELGLYDNSSFGESFLLSDITRFTKNSPQTEGIKLARKIYEEIHKAI